MNPAASGIDSAFDRIDAFVAVQAGRPFPEKVEAVKLLQAAVGIDDDGRRALRDRLEVLGQSQHAGAVLLGLILGLFAASMGEE